MASLCHRAVAEKKRPRQGEDGSAVSGHVGGTVSVEGLAVTWSLEVVYYLPMAELRADPSCCALLSRVLQSSTAEKARPWLCCDDFKSRASGRQQECR